MTFPVAKRYAGVLLAIGIAGSSLALSQEAAFASSSNNSKHAEGGSTCTKSELNETVKGGNTTLTGKEITLYERQK
jgi:hypothetical protein